MKIKKTLFFTLSLVALTGANFANENIKGEEMYIHHSNKLNTKEDGIARSIITAPIDTHLVEEVYEEVVVEDEVIEEVIVEEYVEEEIYEPEIAEEIAVEEVVEEIIEVEVYEEVVEEVVYSNGISFEATAYAVGGWAVPSTVTADGTDISDTIYSSSGYRIIAVDPSVIPMGTVVKVTYSDGTTFLAQASDTGGMIVGNRIDILYDNVEDALSFGRQNVTVEFIN